jgi:hypothetical protein
MPFEGGGLSSLKGARSGNGLFSFMPVRRAKLV